MKTIPLNEFVRDHGQKKVAEMMGVTQSAVSQMLRAGRNVVVDVDACGGFVEAREIRVIKGAAAA